MREQKKFRFLATKPAFAVVGHIFKGFPTGVDRLVRNYVFLFPCCDNHLRLFSECVFAGEQDEAGCID